jgi:hypothetical protein
MAFDLQETILPVDEISSKQDGFEIFPNPSDGAFYINGSSDILDINIVNGIGQSVSSSSCNIFGKKAELSLQGYLPGMYFVEIVTDEVNSTWLRLILY